MSGITLRHGIFLGPYHNTNESPTLTLQRDLELMQWLDGLGYDEAWIGEHHSEGFENIDSPELFIAAAIERTHRIRLGTGVVSLPMHHPLNVVQRIIQLDHQSKGRVMMGVGPGLLATDHHMYGIDPNVTRDRMAQALDVMLRLLRGEVVSEQTDWYTLRDARVQHLPYTRPMPEVAVASAVTPSGGRLAGKYGLGMLCLAANDARGFDALDVNWKVAEDAAATHGKVMNRSQLRVVSPMHLAATREKAKENMRFGLQAYINYRNTNTPSDSPALPIPAGEDAVDWMIRTGYAVIGTPDDAIARIEQIRAKQGEFGCMLMLAVNWADWAATKESYDLYARYVMPHFSKANVNRVASLKWTADNQDHFAQQRVASARQMLARHEAEKNPRTASDQPVTTPKRVLI